MFATREKYRKDSTVKFSSTENTGVLIQTQFRRVIFFRRGITIDDMYYQIDTPASEVDAWIEAKRKFFEKERAQATTPTP